MSFASKLKTTEISTLAHVIFFVAVGVILLALLPFSGFPPHIGLTGVLNLVAAYGLLKKRFWAIWLVGALFVVAMVISLYTLFSLGFSNPVVGVGMVAYAVLALVVTLYLVLKNRPSEA